jgi:hypothetical protein
MHCKKNNISTIHSKALQVADLSTATYRQIREDPPRVDLRLVQMMSVLEPVHYQH